MGRGFVLQMLTGSMGSPPPATSCEGCSEKKERSKRLGETKQEFDSVGGTPFNGVRAIAQRNHVSRACLKRYADCNAKHNHGYITDSSALGGDSGSDDSWDGDSDATM